MRTIDFMTLAILTLSPAAMGADSAERSSPLDRNPACMERTTDASSGNCVISDDGKPRRTYPPKQSPASTAPAPATAATAPPSAVRKSATGK